MKQLIPALRQHCQVQVVDSYVEDIGGLFNRAKVYLYDSAEYWAQQKVSEGFGLQPLEAMACGCQVFSSVNGGLSDYLDPGFNCYKIAGYAKEYDVQRILQVLEAPPRPIPTALLEEYRSSNILHRFQIILTEINEFFDHQPQFASPIPALSPLHLTRLRTQQLWMKINKRFLRRR